MTNSDGKDTEESLNQQGFEYYKARNYVAAIRAYTKSLELNPRNPVVYNMLGFLYQKINRYENVDMQIMYFQKALELRPDYAVAIRNLAFAYPFVDKDEDAIKCFQKLLELDPVPDDYYAFACELLKNGDFKNGWKHYEYRFLKQFGRTYYPEFDKPLWDGHEIKDKVLLVQSEQGFGDSIQFLRYLHIAKKYAKKVIFRVQKELAELFKLNESGFEVVSEDLPLSQIEFDYHVPLMNLLRIFETNHDNIPLAEGYIKADSSKTQWYKEKFFGTNDYKIGISWHGSQIGKKERNIPLKCFYPLARLEGVQVYSLQKGADIEQLRNLPSDVNIVDLRDTFGSFSDTAAAMANLDLFVTSDNSLLNLAGSMGVKTMLLLNKYSEWRWFFDTERTPWYDSVRIFKKTNELQSWDFSMQGVIDNLPKNILEMQNHLEV